MNEEQRADTVVVSAIEPEEVAWIWRDHLPLGKLVVVDGDPGTNKTSAFLDIAARVSRGGQMPDGSRSDFEGAYGTVFLNAEDGPADTLRPRLEAAGADLDKILLLQGVKLDIGTRLPTVHDLEAIIQAIAEVNAVLVVIDPLMAYLGSRTNSYRDQDVREALAPLARLAERSRVCVVVIRHLNKGQHSNPLYRGGGSIGIIGAARVGLLIAADPDDEERRILAVNKCNLAPKAPSLAFRPRTDPAGHLCISWEGEAGLDARELLAVREGDDERSALDDAVAVLTDLLHSGPMAADNVLKATRRAGISERTVRRAKACLGIRSEKECGVTDGPWRWVLPSTNGAGNVGNDGNLQEDTPSLGDQAKVAKAAKYPEHIADILQQLDLVPEDRATFDPAPPKVDGDNRNRRLRALGYGGVE